MVWVAIALAVIIGLLIAALRSQYKHNLNLVKDYRDIETKLVEEIEKNKVIISQKKSSETRLGQTTEHLVPFLEGFPYDPKDCHFLGMPIDYIVFDFDEGKIVFVEVKTGNARESDRQKKIKNMIKTGRVYYNRVRLNEKGMKVSEEKNND